jgi:acylphosphatase
MAGTLKGVLINVSGVVQGIGFRWYVKRIAERYGVKGYVKNLYDGSVETYAEGEYSPVKAFFDEVKIGPHHAHISGVKVEWMESKGQYKDFRIEI